MVAMNSDIAKSDSTSFEDSIKSALHILKNQSAGPKIFGGTAAGWIVGVLVRKTGKIVLFAAGSGIVILQITREKGFVKVDWSQVSKSVANMRENLESGIIRRWFQRLTKVIKYDSVLLSGFVGGFLIGLSSG